MSLTKENHEEYFENKTIQDMEFHQQEEEPNPFHNLPDLMLHLNGLPRVRLTAKIVKPFHPHHKLKAIVKGRFRGMIYVSDSPRLKEIQTIIESYGYTILETFFLEESDEKFTNLSFTIKNQSL